MFAVDPGEQQVITRVLSAPPLYKQHVKLSVCSACGPAAVGAAHPGDRATAVRGPAGGAAGSCRRARGGNALHRNPAPGGRRAAAGEAGLQHHSDIVRLINLRTLVCHVVVLVDLRGHMLGHLLQILHAVCLVLSSRQVLNNLPPQDALRPVSNEST
jgi:hypothetical protein